MTNVDQFESVFRSADKEVFKWQSMPVSTILVVTDLGDPRAYEFGEELKNFLKVLNTDKGEPEWDIIIGNEFDTIVSLLDLVKNRNPDLICAYRHLHSDQWQNPYTLGEYIEVLTQATKIPVLVVPHPEAKRASAHAMRDTNTVMAVTDHLTGDHHLVNWAVRFTEANGTLFLTHVEDSLIFERYINAISKIPALDTETARETINTQLLKEPADFIRSCNEALKEQKLPVHIEEIVSTGHFLKEYRKLIEQHEVDLLVFNTKDDDQLAMHGLGYPLAVELREIPLLML